MSFCPQFEANWVDVGVFSESCKQCYGFGVGIHLCTVQLRTRVGSSYNISPLSYNFSFKKS